MTARRNDRITKVVVPVPVELKLACNRPDIVAVPPKVSVKAPVPLIVLANATVFVREKISEALLVIAPVPSDRGAVAAHIHRPADRMPPVYELFVWIVSVLLPDLLRGAHPVMLLAPEMV